MLILKRVSNLRVLQILTRATDLQEVAREADIGLKKLRRIMIKRLHQFLDMELDIVAMLVRKLIIHYTSRTSSACQIKKKSAKKVIMSYFYIFLGE
jgi:hypothetical protein